MYSTFQPSSAPSPESSHPEPESSRTGGVEGRRARALRGQSTLWAEKNGLGAGGRRGEIPKPLQSPNSRAPPSLPPPPPPPPMPVPMPMERKQAAYSNLVRASSSTLVFRSIPLSIYFDLISVSAERWPWRLQDERYAIQGEKYQGQQYCHIYFTRLRHMRNLLHALVPSWKPHIPGPPPHCPLLSRIPLCGKSGFYKLCAL